MFQESLGFRDIAKWKSEEKKKKRAQDKKLKSGAMVEYWNTDKQEIVRVERYWISKSGVKYMYRMRTSAQMIPKFDDPVILKDLLKT